MNVYSISEGVNPIAAERGPAQSFATWGLRRLWRRQLCHMAAELSPPGARVLDVATGTGEVILELLGEYPDLVPTGVDTRPVMLQAAREKLAQAEQTRRRRIALKLADCRSLPFAGEHFDTVTVSWGLSGDQPIQDSLREIHRVLRPGGALVVLEGGIPESTLMRSAQSLYTRALPLIGGWVSARESAAEGYAAECDSERLAHIPCGQAFVDEMTEAGFEDSAYEALLGGLSYLYAGVRGVSDGPPTNEAAPRAELSTNVLIGNFAGAARCSQLDRLAA